MHRDMKTSRLIAAIRTGDHAEVLAALKDGADIEEADMHGCAGLPLRTACFSGNTAIVSTLIKHGADVNAAGSDGPSAPLRLARRRGHDDIFGLLLKHGAQVPDDVKAPQPVLNCAIPPLEFPAAPKPADERPGNLIEFSLPETTAATSASAEEGEGEFGEQTRLLSMDLFFDQQEVPPPEPAKAAGNADGSIDFWQSTRRSHG